MPVDSSMDDDDDDLDFFTRKPSTSRTLSRNKSSSVSDVTATSNGLSAPTTLSSAREPSPSSSKLSVPVKGEVQPAFTSSSEDESVTLLSSSGEEADDNTRVRRGPKRKKRRHLPTLPEWSREMRSSSVQSVELAGSSARKLTPIVDVQRGSVSPREATGETQAGPSREREVSLSPPPAPSPDKLWAARQLVNHVSESRRKIQYSPPLDMDSNSVGKQSNGPRIAIHGADCKSQSQENVQWDPEVAKLYRGDDAKQIRERAKKEEEARRKRRSERDRLRSQTQVSAEIGHAQDANPKSGGAMPRTVSAPVAVSSPALGGKGMTTTSSLPSALIESAEDSDDSIKLVSRITSIHNRSTGGKKISDAIMLSDSDDDAGTAAIEQTQREASQQDDTEATEEVGEVMSLTLSSSLGTLQVSVRSTALLSKIVAHFVTTFQSESRPVKQRLPANVDVSRIKFRIDGETISPNPKGKKPGVLCDLDVEDGDLVEVVW